MALSLSLILLRMTAPSLLENTASSAETTSPIPLHLTAEQDRQRLLGLLGLKESDLRPAPVPDARSPKATNYNEAKASVYSNLPDPLVLKNGQPVKTPMDWSKRKREIWGDFDREVLGKTPMYRPSVEWHIISTTNEKYGGVDVVTKRLAGRVGPWMNTQIAFSIDLLLTVPAQVRESAYGLGATTGEVVMKVTLPYIRRGAIGAVMLGLGRALGETMAVTFIIGNSHDFPKGFFDSGATIASTIANEFNEASGLQASALIALGLVLFVLTFLVLALARLLLRQSES